MGKKLLEVKDLHTSFFTANGEVKSVNGVSYYIDEHEIVAVVGESGCGKSVTQMSVMQLVQSPPGKIKSGEVLLENKNLLEYDPGKRGEAGMMVGTKTKYVEGLHMTDAATEAYKQTVKTEADALCRRIEEALK